MELRPAGRWQPDLTVKRSSPRTTHSQRVLNRMEVWEHLTPEQKQTARGIYTQMQNLPPERRAMVRTAIRDLRAMPPEQRHRVIESDRFKSTFSPQERDLLNGAARLPLAPPAEPPDNPNVPRPPH